MRKRISIFVIAVFVLALFAGGAFAGQDDSVLSQDIKEADGTTGQDTNTGSGVKTGHIQDGAVTSGKIADGAVATGDIADGAVTDAKITGPISGAKLGSHGHSGADITDGTVTTPKVADGAITDMKITGPISGSKLGSHSHSGADITDGTVTTPKVADGAITDMKITGPISASKIESTGLDADTVDGLHGSDLAPVVHTHEESDVNGLVSDLANKADISHNHDGSYAAISHNHDGVYQKKYGKVAIVAVSGGDYTDPATALNNILSWCGVTSETNRCLLKIMPGVFDIGSNKLDLRPYLDIEGSGESVTVIRGNNNSLQGVVDMNGGTNEIRDLTIENTGGGLNAVAISANYVNNSSIDNVTAIASGGTYNYGIFIQGTYSLSIKNTDASAYGGTKNYGIFNYLNSSTVMDNVSASADGGTEADAIWNYDGSSLIMSNVYASASRYGLRNYSQSTTSAKSCTLEGSSGSIYNNSTANIAHSQLIGPISGTLNCYGVYDASYQEVTCP